MRETPDKIEALVKHLPKDVLVRRDQGSWSIQENVGHLLTAESLFWGRLDDYENNAPVLQVVHFEDNPTDKARFNEWDLQRILAEFRVQRDKYLQRVEALSPGGSEKAILHPRLNKLMRLRDTLFLQVEHDRHHMTRIAELNELWNVNQEAE